MPETNKQPGENVIARPIGTGGDQPSSIAALVDLGSGFYDYYSWSNDAGDFPIATYFDPEIPNLGLEFGLLGLQPMLKDRNDDVYILKDAKDSFYKFDAHEGTMHCLVTEEKDPLKVAMMVVQGIPAEMWRQQWDPSTVRRS